MIKFLPIAEHVPPIIPKTTLIDGQKIAIAKAPITKDVDSIIWRMSDG